MHIFKKTARGSEYEEKALIEGVKRSLNEVVRRRLIESEQLSRIIKKCYKISMAINRNWR